MQEWRNQDMSDSRREGARLWKDYGNKGEVEESRVAWGHKGQRGWLSLEHWKRQRWTQGRRS